MISQKVLQMMRQVDSHISKKERLKALSVIEDIEKANRIFLRELGYIPNLFSYPFGEYSEFMRDYISHNFDLTQISQEDFDFNLTPTQIQGPRPGLSNMAQIISHCSFQDDFDLTLT